MNKNLLLIGKRHKIGGENLSGGAIVLFEHLIKELNARKLNFDIIDTNYRNYSDSKLLAYFSIIFRIFKKVKGKDIIMLNGSNNVVLQYMPLLLFLRKNHNPQILLRLFGGNYDTYLHSLFSPLQMLAKWVIKRTDKVFYEPKHVLNKLQYLNPNSIWFPNVRNNSPIKTNPQFNRNFIYLGHIRKEKGIDELLEAFSILKTQGFSLSIYGNNVNYHAPHNLNNLFSEVYKGPIKSNQAYDIIRSCDVLILPSYWKGEGYPGVIIEALSVGVPVIATKLSGIEEMVDETCGKLIPSQNSEAIIDAVKWIEKQDYKKLSEGALEHFQLFNAEKVMDRIIDEIYSN